MKFSLSVRCAESPKRKDQALMPFDELAERAAAAGFQALCMRASVIDVNAPAGRVADVRSVLEGNGLTVSLVTGDVALAANTSDATRALDDITPYLDLAAALGARAVRVMAHHEDDIERLRRAADAARALRMQVLHQTHWGTLCETLDETLDVVHAVDNPAFGITLDAGNLLACTGEALPRDLSRLMPAVHNVYFQNLYLDGSSPVIFPSRHRGRVGVRYLALDDAAGIDLHALTDTLEENDFDGWFTVHQPLRDGQTVAGAIEEAARVMLPLRSAGG